MQPLPSLVEVKRERETQQHEHLEAHKIYKLALDQRARLKGGITGGLRVEVALIVFLS